MATSAFGADQFKLFGFKDSHSIELQGTADVKELNKLVSRFGATATGELSIGAYEYPFFLTNYREFWMAAKATRNGRPEEFTYFFLITDSPFTRWLNDGLGYKLTFEKGDIDLRDNSFTVRDLHVSMGSKDERWVNETMKIEHYEGKIVSVFRMLGEAIKRDFDPTTDEVSSSKLLSKLNFKPKTWIVRFEAEGTVHVPWRTK